MFSGADAISNYSCVALLAASGLALFLSAKVGSLGRRGLKAGLVRSARQIMPAVPMLACIALVSTTWMLSGVVPTLIVYGLKVLNPTFFLVITCAVCAVISVLTGSSWSTIATIGVAFMGIGTVMGYDAGWIAGAIISGAYFGDKVSPLSDTTVVASSACGVDLFKHIRYMMLTSGPAMFIALVVFAIKGFFTASPGAIDASEILGHLHGVFNITPWVFVIPVITGVLIGMRVNTVLTLAVSSLLGLAGVFVFQPQLLPTLGIAAGATPTEVVVGTLHFLVTETSFDTGYELFDSLVSTGGLLGMVSTVELILCAMLFGSAMMGTGMLATITHAITRRLQKRFSTVAATVGSGLFLNMCTADQYLSIIIGGNMYRDAYRRSGMEPRLLSRTIEDSVSVTSVLIPWNSCGVTQSAVLGVSTLVYFPYCLFNYLSPVMSLVLAYTGFKIKQIVVPTVSTSVDDAESDQTPVPAVANA